MWERSSAASRCKSPSAISPSARPVCSLSGGETTVTVRGTGRGGRNVGIPVVARHCARWPSAHSCLGRRYGWRRWAGRDRRSLHGPGHARARLGATVCGPRTCSPITMRHGFFSALGDSVVTGPTLTNVNDFRAILIERRADRGALIETGRLDGSLNPAARPPRSRRMPRPARRRRGGSARWRPRTPRPARCPDWRTAAPSIAHPRRRSPPRGDTCR